MARSTQHQWHSFARPSLRRSEMQRPTKRQPLERRLRIEPLEDRRLLALVTVDTLDDTVDFGDGMTSLREAVFATNTVPGADTIDFAASLTSGGPATILLTQGELAITDSLTINGPGANLLTFDASGNDPTPDVNNVDGSRVFVIDDGNSANVLDVSISGLSLTGGDGGAGGAIASQENLTVTNSTISGNSASSGGAIHSTLGDLTVSDSTISGNVSIEAGGGIYIRNLSSSGGNLTVLRSTISDNSSRHNTGGGIDFNAASTYLKVLTITDSVINNNSAFVGGGIWATSATVTLTGSTISGNSADRNGGGIRNSNGTLTVIGSTITDNRAGVDDSGFGGGGGGIYCSGSTVLTNSTISGNSADFLGGGVRATSLTSIDSAITNNSAFSGGGIAASIVNVTNSTISGNSAMGGINGGGGIFGSTVTVTSSTIVGNIAGTSGGGIRSLGPTALSHSIVADNTSGVVPSANDISGNVALAFSLLGVDTGATITDNGGNLIGTAAAPIDPLLGPLADNGGPTFMHALLAGSPAINRGDLNTVAGVGGVSEFDQRGTPFGRVFGGRIDIGAFEYQAASDLNLVVDTLTDESDGNFALGDLSLREAILLANTFLSDDTIRFAPALVASGPATILLTMGELKITDNTSIIGLGDELLTIDASGNDPTPDSTLDDGDATNDHDGSRVFNIDDVNTANVLDVSISGLTLTGGDVSAEGGAIRSRENLTVTDSAISGNSASGSSFSYGGGIRSLSGTLIVTNSTISDNSASGSGGGIWKSGGSLTITDSAISGNSAGVIGSGGGIRTSGALTVTNSTISGNSSGGDGGGILASNGLTLTDSAISENSSGGDGGGIRVSGVLTVSGSSISENSANGTGSKGDGGGIYITSGFGLITTITNSKISDNLANRRGGGIYTARAITLSGSTISGNSSNREGGGGIWNRHDALTVTGSTISGNSTAASGGGIYSGRYSSSMLTVVGSTISGNSAGEKGGGIYDRSGTTLTTGSTISGNSAQAGGGISSSGTLVVTDSLMHRNTAGVGGGIRQFNGSLTVTNSTISGNTAVGNGGGLYLFTAGSSVFTVRHSTIVNNTASGLGGGITVFGGSLNLDHIIVAQNTAALGRDVIPLISAVIDAHFNLIGDNANSGLVEAPVGSPDANGNLIGGTVHGVINPLLGPLGSNGGLTMTHALLFGSPAMDVGDPSAVVGATVPEFDQRGASFARVFGGRIDIGAFERQSAPGPLVVDTLVDESDADYSTGDFSLREAIELANGYAGSNIVKFAAALTAAGPAAIILSHGELAITESLIVNGPGAELLTIDASGNDPTPNVNNGDGSRIFNISDGLVAFFPNSPVVQDVVIRGLTLTGGDFGGAINNAERLTIERTTISGNSASFAAGGITTYGDLTVTSSTISGNSTGGDGGAIRASSGNIVTITDSLISGNKAAGYGGGVAGYKADFTVTRSTISHNSAGRQGGGISARMADSGLTLTKTVTITDSTITGNSAGSSGGGVSSSSLRILIVTITNSTISGNSAVSRGGGVYMRADGTINARTILANCTVTNNTAGSGGGAAGIGFSTPIVLDRTTVSGNTASGFGGGIAADRLVMDNSTISGNTADAGGGGIASSHTWITGSTISNNSTAGSGGGISHGGGYLTIAHSSIIGNSANVEGGGIRNFDTNDNHNRLTHTIVAGNLVAGSSDDIRGTFPDIVFGYSSGNNLIGVDTGFTGMSNGTNGNQIGTAAAPIDPLLGPLADNGGPTMTHALLAGSPATNAGDPTAVVGFNYVPQFDQRGAPLGRIFGGRIDIGAFESQPLPAAMFGDYNGNGEVDTADFVMWRRTLSQSVAPYSGADGSGNGVIDQGDYGVWRAHFGETVSASVAASGTSIAVISTSADPHLLDTSQPLPEGEVVGALAEPGVAVTRTVREYRAVRSTFRDVPRAARHDDALAAWLAERSSGDFGRGDRVIQRDTLRGAATAAADFDEAVSDGVFELIGAGDMATVGNM